MAESREMWALFSAEAGEHLEELGNGLLRLEKEPEDRATLDRVFRAAHSLKGAARMMGALEVEQLSHAFEDALTDAKKHGAQLSPFTVESLYSALDTLRLLIKSAVAGEVPRADITEVLQALAKSPSSLPEAPRENSSARAEQNAEPISDRPLTDAPLAEGPREGAPILAYHSPDAPPVPRNRESAPSPSSSSSASNSKLPVVEVVAPRGQQNADDGGWKIETMRVDPARLDALLSLSGELLVGAKRARRGRNELEAAQLLREDALKLAIEKRRALRQIEGALESAFGSASAPLVREMERLFAREAERWDGLGAHFDRLRVASDEISGLENVATELEAAIRGVRLLPLSTLFGQFPRAVRDLAKSQGKMVEFLVEGGDVRADKRILEELKDPLLHLVRNALDHGIELPSERVGAGKPQTAILRMKASQTATQIVVEVSDDGRGLSLEKIAQSALRKGLVTQAELGEYTPKQIEELIFAPGFSTASIVTDLSGRGVGLDVVRENVENLRGQISVESIEGRGCTFRLALPVTLATTRVLLVKGGAQIFALPIDSILSVHHLREDALYLMQGRRSFTLGDEAIPTVSLRDILRLPQPLSDENQGTAEGQSYIVLSLGSEKLGLGVDLVVDEQEIILKSLGRRFRALSHLAGATILENGDVCLVLNPQEIIKLASSKSHARPHLEAHNAAPALKAKPKTVLLCEDSITTRTQEKRILENAGYLVTVAVDGADGWEKLRAAPFDAVVTDVEMPNLDGFELTRRIRAHDHYAEIPIVLVTTLSSEEDRARGLEVGANAYITKGGFEGKNLVETLRKLV